MKTTLHIRKTIMLLILAFLCSTATKAQLSWSGNKTMTHGQIITDTITLTGNVTISVDSGDTAIIDGAIFGDYKLTKAGSGTLMLNGDKRYTGTTVVTLGILKVKVAPFRNFSSPGIVFQTSSVSVGNNALIIFDVIANGNMPFIFNKVISDGELAGGAIGKIGSGKLILTAENTYTGTTVVSEGILMAGNHTSGSISSTSNVMISSGATLCFAPEGDLDFDKQIRGAGNVEFSTISSDRVFGLYGNHTYTGTTSLVEGSELYIYGKIIGDVLLVENTYLGLFPTSDWTYNGVISGEGDVSISGGNTVSFSSFQEYTGKTYIHNATLALVDLGFIYQSSGVEFTHADGKFDVSGFDDDGVVDVKKLTSSFTNTEVIVGGNHLSIGSGVTDEDMGSYAGKITGDGNGSVGKGGNGKWTFSGTVSGLTEIGSYKGSLQLSSDIDCNLYLNDNAALIIDGNRIVTGDLQIGSGLNISTIDFDLTATVHSKLTVSGTISITGSNDKILNVKADTEGTYDLIELTGISAAPFTLNMTGAWTDGELVVNNNKLQLTITGDVSVNEIRPEHAFTIYPNPTMGELKIMSKESKINAVVICDINGRILKQIESPSSEIDVRDLSIGVYFIKIITEEGEITKKIIKN
ncbi:MAG: T9SS type A sorting domain-containing protein [Bacteroidales bacterium]|jgi:autotransporter-associated beta strand protein|nr:T9SS type A sorting domain-containing protein [Bacteroidales bacterium]